MKCNRELRRHEVRRQERNGLDYVEVGADQRTLTAFFLGPAPTDLGPENLEIRGGRRIRGIRVLDVEACPPHDPELDACVVVTVDRPGDFSTYELHLVGLPQDTPFDPRYRSAPFSFKAACPTELDCATPPACPEEPAPRPAISYLAKDYASFRRLLLDRLAETLPDWRDREIPDLGITLVELLAYVGDQLSYHQDAVATEAYLGTARRRISVRRHARLVDYRMHEGCNARSWIHVHATAPLILPAEELSFLTPFPELPEVEDRILRWEELERIPARRYEVFEPLGAGAELSFHPAHNELRFHTWGDGECCLPRGTTSASLVAPGEEAPLAPGDVLLLEEVLGPRTGNPADADPAHRHPVRLTRVTAGRDDLLDVPILEVEWATEDALPFPLCLSSLGPAPECRPLEDVSVARGNMVLADHGRRVDPGEEVGAVPTETPRQACEGPGSPADPTPRAGRFRPVLDRGPLTFREPLPPGDGVAHPAGPPGLPPASRLLVQDPRRALPELVLEEEPTPEHPGAPWFPRGDLLASSREDRHLVVEMDDDRRAHLRFGDGELGRAPRPGARFRARYRVGNGPAGNVGAETLTVAVTSGVHDGVALHPRNPLPATGGTAPESVEEVKRLAPHAFRHRLARAVTARDYAELAGRHPAVQGAAAELRWTGSWYEARVGVDALGQAEAPEALLEELRAWLEGYRRLGHDLAVVPAHPIPLKLELEVCVAPGQARGHVRAALLRRFGNGRRRDGTPAFFHPDALHFGQDLPVSRIVAAAMEVPGVESATVRRLERLFQGPAGEVETGVLRVGPMEIPRLDNDPSLPENGRLRLELRGGR
jgi:hypothetical protein